MEAAIDPLFSRMPLLLLAINGEKKVSLIANAAAWPTQMLLIDDGTTSGSSPAEA